MLGLSLRQHKALASMNGKDAFFFPLAVCKAHKYIWQHDKFSRSMNTQYLKQSEVVVMVPSSYTTLA